jgi:hypothetical protein
MAAMGEHNASSAAPGKGKKGAEEEEEEEKEEEAAEFHDAVSPDEAAAEREEGELAADDAAAAATAAAGAGALDPAAAAAAAAASDVEGGSGEEEEAAVAAAVEEELSGPEAVRRRRAEEAGQGKGKKPKDKYNAKMQWVITGRMKQVLMEELHYLPEEVEAMMPDVAAVVINKHLERPKQGMPPEWRRDFHLRSRGLKRVRASIRRALARVKEDPASVVRGVVTVAAGAVAVVAAKRWRDARVAEEEDEYEWVEMTPWEELLDNIQTRLPALPFRKGGSS